MNSCPANLRKLSNGHILTIVHIGMISAMSVYMVQIHKIFKDHRDKYAHPQANAPISNSQNVCFSSSSADVFAKLNTYKDVVFYSIVASSIANLFFLGFQYIMYDDKTKTSTKTIPNITYGPLSLVGWMVFGFSLWSFLKLNSMKDQPVECKGVMSKFKVFFIMGMTIGAAQAVGSMGILLTFHYNYALTKA